MVTVVGREVTAGEVVVPCREDSEAVDQAMVEDRVVIGAMWMAVELGRLLEEASVGDDQAAPVATAAGATARQVELRAECPSSDICHN